MPQPQSTRIPRVCPVCKNEFLVYPSTLAAKRGTYCSRTCRTNSIPKIDCRCGSCGKVFALTPNRMKGGLGKHCSQSCYNASKCNIRIPLMDRIQSRTVVEGECWVYKGSTSQGYPYLTTGSSVKGTRCSEAISRISYRLHRGPIPDKMDVCHTCDNPPCWRPDHLFLGTRKENLQDAARKGRMSPQINPHLYRGGNHANAKLTEAIVIDIRQRYSAGGVTITQLALEHGVSKSAASQAIRRATWRHV